MESAQDDVVFFLLQVPSFVCGLIEVMNRGTLRQDENICLDGKTVKEEGKAGKEVRD